MTPQPQQMEMENSKPLRTAQLAVEFAYAQNQTTQQTINTAIFMVRLKHDIGLAEAVDVVLEAAPWGRGLVGKLKLKPTEELRGRKFLDELRYG